jgi:hypothetical protein
LKTDLLFQPPDEIDKLFSNIKGNYLKGNHIYKSPRAYDDPLPLAKLFVQPWLSWQNLLLLTKLWSMSAVLSIMCEPDLFVTSGAAVDAKTIMSNIRNK